MFWLTFFLMLGVCSNEMPEPKLESKSTYATDFLHHNRKKATKPTTEKVNRKNSNRFRYVFSAAISVALQPKSRFRLDNWTTEKVKIGSYFGSGISLVCGQNSLVVDRLRFHQKLGLGRSEVPWLCIVSKTSKDKMYSWALAWCCSPSWWGTMCQSRSAEDWRYARA